MYSGSNQVGECHSPTNFMKLRNGHFLSDWLGGNGIGVGNSLFQPGRLMLVLCMNTALIMAAGLAARKSSCLYTRCESGWCIMLPCILSRSGYHQSPAHTLARV